jgi:hypothetical protein
MKQTAVDWLDSNLIHAPHSQEDFTHNYRVFEQAKAMEQEQMAEKYKQGFDEGTEALYKEVRKIYDKNKILYGIHD